MAYITITKQIIDVISEHYDPIKGQFDRFGIRYDHDSDNRIIMDQIEKDNSVIIKSIIQNLENTKNDYSFTSLKSQTQLGEVVYGSNGNYIFIEIDNKASVKIYIHIEKNEIEIFSFRFRNEPLMCVYNYSKKMIGVPKEKNMNYNSDYPMDSVVAYLGPIPIVPITKPKIIVDINISSDYIWPEDILVFESYKDLKMLVCFSHMKECSGKLLYWSDSTYSVLEDIFGAPGYNYIVMTVHDFYIPTIVYEKYMSFKKDYHSAEESVKLLERFLPIDIITIVNKYAYKIVDNDASYKRQETSFIGQSCSFCIGMANDSRCECDKGIPEYNEITKEYIDKEDPFLVQAVLDSSLEERKCRWSCLYVSRYPKKYRPAIKYRNETEYLDLAPY